jgi:hypothetical protein
MRGQRRKRSRKAPKTVRLRLVASPRYGMAPRFTMGPGQSPDSDRCAFDRLRFQQLRRTQPTPVQQQRRPIRRLTKTNDEDHGKWGLARRDRNGASSKQATAPAQVPIPSLRSPLASAVRWCQQDTRGSSIVSTETSPAEWTAETDESLLKFDESLGFDAAPTRMEAVF